MSGSDLNRWLWFDVGIKRYTTNSLAVADAGALWFDVGIKRYTTTRGAHGGAHSCGLM